MRKILGQLKARITGSGIAGAKAKAAEGGTTTPAQTDTTATTDGAADQATQTPPDAIKPILDLVAKLTPEQVAALVDQLGQMRKSMEKATAAGASPDQAAKIAQLETELSNAKAQIKDFAGLKVKVQELEHKVSSGAESITQKPQRASSDGAGEEKPMRSFYSILTGSKA